MKFMWVTITWFALSLCMGTAWGAEIPPTQSDKTLQSFALPWIHLVRINDPIGAQGFDLACEQEEEEPYCAIAVIRPNKRPDKVVVSFDRAKAIVEKFLSRIPKKMVSDVSKEKKMNPPIRDVLILWRVKLGDKVSNGFVKRSRKDLGVDPKTLRALLLLESELWNEK